MDRAGLPGASRGLVRRRAGSRGMAAAGDGDLSVIRDTDPDLPEPFLSVIVPVLNEEACVASFIDRMRAELSRLVPSWEILVIDDGSTDRTREIVEAEAKHDGRVRLVLMDHRG